MSFSSFRIDAGVVLVADASVVINLNATGRAIEIIGALPASLAVTDNAQAELTRGALRGHRDAEQLQQLITGGAVHLSALGENGGRVYVSLVEGAAAETLDDGEAATIAYAQEIGGIALIDERKARRICAERFPGLGLGSTVDVLLHPLVERSLGREGQIEAILNALRGARMRVLQHQIPMVVNLIGEDAAATCSSLPSRFWRLHSSSVSAERQKSG